MNYLAHLYLADGDAESLIGSLMGDFIKGQVGDRLPPTRRHGVLLHRRVDAFTDRHPVVLRSKARIQPALRRYAGILVDVFYDHYLARHWPEYSALPLDAFVEHVHRVLVEQRNSLPPRMQRSMAYLVRNDLLRSYREVDGVRRALIGIEGRLKRPSGLREAITDLKLNDAALRDDFSEFFPQLVDFAGRASRRLGDVT